MLSPNSFLFIFDHEKSHTTLTANPVLRFANVSTVTILNHLRPQIALLITHEMILINSLT